MPELTNAGLTAQLQAKPMCIACRPLGGKSSLIALCRARSSSKISSSSGSDARNADTAEF
jgi:hypothetical protein